MEHVQTVHQTSINIGLKVQTTKYKTYHCNWS